MGIGKSHWKKYTKENQSGRHDFQIDLGLALLNRGIEMDWVGNKRPDYMRTGEFIPCDCNKCYFCLNGYTTGIAHADPKRAGGRPVAILYKCNKRAKVETCADVKERVNIKKGGHYCKMCYRKQGKVGTAQEKRKRCKLSRLGCPFCQEHICTDCWKSGYDKHK